MAVRDTSAGRNETWTYAQLNVRANQLARVVHRGVDWDTVANGDCDPLVGVMCEVRMRNFFIPKVICESCFPFFLICIPVAMGGHEIGAIRLSASGVI